MASFWDKAKEVASTAKEKMDERAELEQYHRTHCPQCDGTNLSFQFIEIAQKTTRKGLGVGGNVNNAARKATAMVTFGSSNLIWKKSEGVNTTKTRNQKIAICNDCGNDWKI